MRKTTKAQRFVPAVAEPIPTRQFGVLIYFFDETKTVFVEAKAFTVTEQGVLLFVDGDLNDAKAVAAFSHGVWIYVTPVKP